MATTSSIATPTRSAPPPPELIDHVDDRPRVQPTGEVLLECRDAQAAQ